MPRYRAMLDHWQRHPPLGVTAWAIAESLGAKKKPVPVDMKKQQDGSDMQGLLELLGGGDSGFSATEKPQWLTTAK